MKNYVENGNYFTIELENGKNVKVAKKWVDTACQKLDIDVDTALEMWLEDNDYLENEEQNELDKKAKGVIKTIATKETPKKKTQKERTQKDNPTKELIIQTVGTDSFRIYEHK